MRRFFSCTIVILAIGVFALALAQSSPDDPARFRFNDASITPAVRHQVTGCIGTMCGGPRTADPSFAYLVTPLISVLEWAYGKESFQIFGGPSWVTSLFNSDRFDVVAQVPPGTSDAQFAVMLQNLMVDRLGLKVHHESRNLPINILTIAPGGPKLKEMPTTKSSGDVTGSYRDHRHTLSTNGVVSLETLVGSLKHELNEVVVDRTGLTGMYTFSLEWIDAPAGDGTSQLPGLAAALERGLGLRLEKSSQEFDVLVIDQSKECPPGIEGAGAINCPTIRGLNWLPLGRTCLPGINAVGFTVLRSGPALWPSKSNGLPSKSDIFQMMSWSFRPLFSPVARHAQRV